MFDESMTVWNVRSMNTVTKLKEWLGKPGNTPAFLAAQLGYKTSDPIVQWIARKSIPSFQEQRVLAIITKKEKK